MFKKLRENLEECPELISWAVKNMIHSYKSFKDTFFPDVKYSTFLGQIKTKRLTHYEILRISEITNIPKEKLEFLSSNAELQIKNKYIKEYAARNNITSYKKLGKSLNISRSDQQMRHAFKGHINFSKNDIKKIKEKIPEFEPNPVNKISPSNIKTQRVKEFAKLKEEGYTFAQIAEKYNVSRQNVQQSMARYDVNTKKPYFRKIKSEAFKQWVYKMNFEKHLDIYNYLNIKDNLNISPTIFMNKLHEKEGYMFFKNELKYLSEKTNICYELLVNEFGFKQTYVTPYDVLNKVCEEHNFINAKELIKYLQLSDNLSTRKKIYGKYPFNEKDIQRMNNVLFPKIK